MRVVLVLVEAFQACVHTCPHHRTVRSINRDAPAGAYVATTAAVAELRSPNAAQRWRGLLNLKHAARHNRADPEWASSWVAAGAVRAIVAGSAAVPPHEAAQQVGIYCFHFDLRAREALGVSRLSAVVHQARDSTNCRCKTWN